MNIFIIMLALYLYPAAFLAGFIICDESSHFRPEYASALFSLIWPLIFGVAIFKHLTE